MLKDTWSWLIRPSDSIREPDQRRQAQLLMSVLLVLMLANILVSFHFLAEMLLYTIFLSTLYGLSRTRFYKLAAALTIGFTSFIIFFLAITSSMYWVIYLVIPVLLSSLLLPRWITTILITANFTGMMLVILIFFPQTHLENMPIVFFLVMSFLILIAAQHRDLLEEDRQAALKASEARYRTLAEHFPNGAVMLIDRNLKYIVADGASIRRAGYTKEEIESRFLKEILSPDQVSLTNTVYHATLNGQECNLRWPATNGKVFEVYTVPIRDQDEQIVAAMVMTQDITQRVQAEEELKKHRDQLEELVEARTAELTAANQRLQELTRLKDQFVSNVSHELRTPVTNLKLYHSLLKPDSAKFDNYLAVLNRETQRLHLIIEDLLHLSRIDQDQVEMKLTTIDLNELVGQYAADRTCMAEQQGLILALETQPNLPAIQADKGMLGQVLSIMLTNAINYTPSGGQITIKTRLSCHDEETWVGFCVSDTGPGIHPDEKYQLFERFYRGATGQQSGKPGTGLGLAIAKEIAEKHHGRIEAEGEPDGGATFSLWLPVQQRC